MPIKPKTDNSIECDVIDNETGLKIDHYPSRMKAERSLMLTSTDETRTLNRRRRLQPKLLFSRKLKKLVYLKMLS